MTWLKCKRSLKPPVVYATDRSTAVVPVLFFFCVALWFILQGASCLVLPCSLFSCFFSSFSIVITSIGDEGALMHLFIFIYLFIYLLHAFIVSFCSSCWWKGLAVASDCGTPWPFLWTLFRITNCISVWAKTFGFSVNFIMADLCKILIMEALSSKMSQLDSLSKVRIRTNYVLHV